ncbi:TetR/AcrR family transcriptional regulator [Acinetobacter equi]|uniref:Transcriptional regulator n=1 Tax=Acinetobacter equi TaxID=1324350 RepID=A0A0N9VF76_9GAMM|nr:TetR/AcrR family transcriptional regulator [Acinetobacter equi]ALH95945.1 transcriptional regulator [Acinetobacter equi]
MHQTSQLQPYAHEIPQTKRGHERCIALLDSATLLFLRYGYDAVSLDDIVNHAGGSKASIYKYFGNKDGLFKAICDYRRQQFLRDLNTDLTDLPHDLKSYFIDTLHNFYNHIKRPENAAFVRMILEQCQRDSKIALYIHENGPKQIQKSISNILNLAHKQNILMCKNPQFSAQMYFGILRNIEWQVVMGIPLDNTDQQITNYIEYAVDLFLYAHQKV